MSFKSFGSGFPAIWRNSWPLRICLKSPKHVVAKGHIFFKTPKSQTNSVYTSLPESRGVILRQTMRNRMVLWSYRPYWRGFTAQPTQFRPNQTHWYHPCIGRARILVIDTFLYDKLVVWHELIRRKAHDNILVIFHKSVCLGSCSCKQIVDFRQLE